MLQTSSWITDIGAQQYFSLNCNYTSVNDVLNTNKCNISICKTQSKNKFIILSSIDNLLEAVIS